MCLRWRLWILCLDIILGIPLRIPLRIALGRDLRRGLGRGLRSRGNRISCLRGSNIRNGLMGGCGSNAGANAGGGDPCGAGSCGAQLLGSRCRIHTGGDAVQGSGGSFAETTAENPSDFSLHKAAGFFGIGAGFVESAFCEITLSKPGTKIVFDFQDNGALRAGLNFAWIFNGDDNTGIIGEGDRAAERQMAGPVSGGSHFSGGKALLAFFVNEIGYIGGRGGVDKCGGWGQ